MCNYSMRSCCIFYLFYALSVLKFKSVRFCKTIVTWIMALLTIGVYVKRPIAILNITTYCLT